MWFVGSARSAAQTDSVATRLRRLDQEVERCDNDMVVHERDHSDLDKRVRELEEELETLRQQRMAAYARWWNTREERDRARHIARRLRRRLERAWRRSGSFEG